MTEIHEQGFRLELPGTWERLEAEEPGSQVYQERDGDGVVSVVMLAVRPVYAIADKQQLLEDYMHHRGNYEKGQTPSLELSDSASQQLGDAIEGAWCGIELETGRRRCHRVVMSRDVLADFCFESSSTDEVTFAENAGEVLGSAVLELD